MNSESQQSAVSSTFRGSRRWLVVAALLGAVVLILMAVRPGSEGPTAPGADRGASGRGGMRLPVDGVVLRSRALDNRLQATGNILAAEDVELRSEASGKVTRVHFREGSIAKKGDLLVKINDNDLQAQLRKARSSKTLIEEKVGRHKKLQEINAVSQEQVDEALNQLNAVSADIDLLLAQIQKTEVRAPFDGVVGLRLVSEGSYISPNITIARFVDIRSVKIDFSIPEKYSAQVDIGTDVLFTIEATSRSFTGSVYAVEPRIDPGTRTLRIRAQASNKEGLILPGTFAKIELILSKIDKAILAPSHAIVPDIEGQKAYVVRDGRARLTPIVSGIRTEDNLQVVDGLNEGDTLIISGLLQLRDGLPVDVRIEQ